MRHRRYKSITFLLALLLAASSWASTPGRAEAQMRCVGPGAASPACARAEMPAAGLSEKQVYGTLMACCRSMSMRGGCATMLACPMMMGHPSSHATMAAHRSSSATRAAPPARRCLVSVRVLAPAPTAPAAHRLRWLLLASPALAPPPAVPAVACAPETVCLTSWADRPILSPHAAPASHGLRAPPAV